jgi:hypothetical protein
VAQSDIDGAQVLEGLSVSPKQIKKLESGGVIAFSDAEYESTKRELAADAMVLVDTDLQAVMDALTSEATIMPEHRLAEFGMVESEDDFSAVLYTEKDIKEVERLILAKPGDDFNFSNSEYELLQQRLGRLRESSPAEQVEAASAAMREILIGRYHAYQADGLDGIADYSRAKGKTVNIGRDIRLSTETFKPFEGDFPAFYKVMHDYPAGAECCEHHFRWIKAKIRKRPTYALVHTVYQKTDDFVLANERYYYATSTLNSVQVTLSWLKYDDDTYMGLAMSASSDLLDSTMARMLRSVGRNMAKDMLTEMMQDVKEELENGDQAEGTNESN